MAKARAAKAEKRGMAQTAERLRTIYDDLADQIEAIDDPVLRKVYSALVANTIDSQRQGRSGLIPTWKVKSSGVPAWRARVRLRRS